MPIDPQEFATMLGAEIVGAVPDVSGGPFGMARLAHIMHERLTPSRGERPGRPTNPNWVTRCKVPMSDATLQRLTELAEKMSTAERKVSPMQVAAQLLEEAVGRVGVKTADQAEGIAGDPADLHSGTGAQTLPAQPIQGVVGPGMKIKMRAAREKEEKQSLPAPSKIRQPRGGKGQEEGQTSSHLRKKA